ncbi:hypothetical protein BJY01DRAFT_247483 [Aspergillus pseudoustus]|uniref:Uncharacterized protein n=1 Tax=Aspergillus pseudoustus TaxID=1810923 RepID=A0ABR4K3R5_9EURO
MFSSTGTQRSEPPCATELTQLSALLPPRGPFEFSLLLTVTRPLEDLSKCLEGARETGSATATCQSPAGLVVPLADSILGICLASCATYGLVGDDPAAAGAVAGTGSGTDTGTGRGTSTGSSGNNSPGAAGTAGRIQGDGPSSSGPPTWRCVKTPMTLGSLALQDEEESLLARQIVCVVLTSLSALLREVYVREKDIFSEIDVVGVDGVGGVGGVGGAAALYGREGVGVVSQCLSRVLALLGKIVPE